jgi:hypothetical protein
MLTIEFEPLGLVDRVEHQIIANLKAIEEEQCLVLDMTSINFIRLETLVYLVAFIAHRKKQNLDTKIKYYTNDSIRKFLHNSRFFETLKDVIGLDIHDLAIDLPPYFDKTSLDVDYFFKPKYEFLPDGITRVLTDKERLEHWRDIGFYPLTSLPFSTDPEKSFTLKEEPKNWTEGKPLVSIIQRNLPDKILIGDKISKHIIYESITNAIRHPKCHKLVISCMKQEKFYTLVIWDNGESIVDTLMSELKKGNSIKAEDSIDDFHSCYCIQTEKNPGPPKAEYFKYFFSFEVPDLTIQEDILNYRSKEWFVLLSSLFPGITRDPKGTDYQQSEILNQEEKPTKTGRGLTYLINAAVRNFGGEVRIRTSNYFINVKRADKEFKTLPDLFFKKFKDEYFVIDYKSKYEEAGITPHNKKIINSLFKAKIHEFPKVTGDFHGNMITIHIPQK